jgi:hypothetical protein
MDNPNMLGLADTLRSELLLHNISVHIFMPCGIKSAGWDEEQKLKPRVTKKIEESDDVLPGADVARSLIAGRLPTSLAGEELADRQASKRGTIR